MSMAEWPQPNPEQQAVNKKHWHTNALFTEANAIVKKNKMFQDLSLYLISTTKHSQVLIVIGDYKDKLPYNSYSKDENNPWLVNGYVQVSDPEFHEKLREYWDNKNVPANWNICPFRVYEWNENASKWEERDLEIDLEDKVVSVIVKDQKVWCHPPRPFQVLQNACNEVLNKPYNQTKGNLRTAIAKFQNVDTNEKIPDDQKPERKIQSKDTIKSTFDKFYKIVEKRPWDDNTKLTSYRYPTLQMRADKDYQPGNVTKQRPADNMNRFGGDSSGVHKDNDNEAHYRLEKEGTEPIPNPTKEVLWDWVVKSFEITNPPTYQELFQE
jgi:hypothetical protein